MAAQALYTHLVNYELLDGAPLDADALVKPVSIIHGSIVYKLGFLVVYVTFQTDFSVVRRVPS